jgi:prepilin-type N-terminal cleavage/methylation domain-containing protein
MLRSRRDHRAGFSMIELMMIVAIIAILAVVSVSSYYYFRKKALTVEAPLGLDSMARHESAYKDEHGFYTTNLSDLGFRMDGTARYAFDVPQADGSSFTARATANLDSDDDLDVWTLDDKGTLIHQEKD